MSESMRTFSLQVRRRVCTQMFFRARSCHPHADGWPRIPLAVCGGAVLQSMMST